jgi:hypothetical protein
MRGVYQGFRRGERLRGCRSDGLSGCRSDGRRGCRCINRHRWFSCSRHSSSCKHASALNTNACQRTRGANSTKHTQIECVHALKGLPMPCARHAAEIATSGSHHQRSTLRVEHSVAYMVSFYCFVTKACARRPGAAASGERRRASRSDTLAASLAFERMHILCPRCGSANPFRTRRCHRAKNK